MNWIDQSLNWLDSVADAYPILLIPLTLFVVVIAAWMIVVVFSIVYHSYYFVRNAENWLIYKLAKKVAEAKSKAIPEEDKNRRTDQIMEDEAIKRATREKNETE